MVEPNYFRNLDITVYIYIIYRASTSVWLQAINNFDNGRQKKKAYDGLPSLLVRMYPRFGLYKYLLSEFGTIGIELGTFRQPIRYALLSCIGVCCCDLCMTNIRYLPRNQNCLRTPAYIVPFNPLLPATKHPQH